MAINKYIKLYGVMETNTAYTTLGFSSKIIPEICENYFRSSFVTLHYIALHWFIL